MNAYYLAAGMLASTFGGTLAVLFAFVFIRAVFELNDKPVLVEATILLAAAVGFLTLGVLALTAAF